MQWSFFKSFSFISIFFFFPHALANSGPSSLNPYSEKQAALQQFFHTKNGADLSHLDENEKGFNITQITQESCEEEIEDAAIISVLQSAYPQPTYKETRSLREKGYLDPNFPDHIKIEPQKIPVPKNFQTKFQKYTANSGHIDIKNLDPYLLKSLTNKELKDLVAHLNTFLVKVRWKNRNGDILSGKKIQFIRTTSWNETTAAGALALLIGAQKHTELLAKILPQAPEACVSALAGPAAAVMDARVAAQALFTLLQDAQGDQARQIAVYGQHIASLYLAYWAEENPDMLAVALSRLFFEINSIILQSNTPFDLKQKGILLGFFLAGCMTHAQKIKTSDERRLWVINSISNLAWAATTYIGVVPLAGSVIAAVTGTISIGVVVWAVVANKVGVRDFTPKIREIESHIEFSALEIVRGNHPRERVTDILEILAWMRATIHMNGFSD